MNVFFVFPHPDDETIFAGGTMARHVSNGDKVIWVCVSYGERSGKSSRRSARLFYILFLLVGIFRFLIRIQNLIIWWLSIFRKSSKTLVSIRKSEAEKVAKIYGVQSLHFLNVPDMQFSENKEKIIQKITDHVKSYKPRIIYTLHPNGIIGHPDHIVLSKAVILATKNITPDKKPEIFGSTIPKKIVRKFHLPLIGVDAEEISKEISLSEPELVKKLQAINAYTSQKYLWEIFLQKYPELLGREYFSRLI